MPSYPLRVLVVDDSRFVRRILKLLLESTAEFVVAGQAEDGIQGLALARELQPDIITLDVDMPQLDGLEMFRLLRMESEVPVVFVTGLPNLAEELASRSANVGAVEIVVKTFSDNPMDLSVFGEELVQSLRAATKAMRYH